MASPLDNDKYRNCKYQICSEAEVEDYPEDIIINAVRNKENLKLFGPILNATYDPSFLESR